MLLASHRSTSSFLAYLRLETLPFPFTLVVGPLLLVFLWVFLIGWLSFQALFSGSHSWHHVMFYGSHAMLCNQDDIYLLPRCFAASAYITLGKSLAISKISEVSQSKRNDWGTLQLNWFIYSHIWDHNYAHCHWIFLPHPKQQHIEYYAKPGCTCAIFLIMLHFM
jgi:hypothetical protein